jgi:succinate dehydrogenase / fumarate reductase membrane anchor subunit
MKESTLWFLHTTTALVLVIAVPIHLHNFSTLLQPVGASGYELALSWEFVRSRARDIFYTITYTALLGAATFHGMYGVRSIIYELTLTKTLERLTSIICFLAGIALFSFGAYVAIAALGI